MTKLELSLLSESLDNPKVTKKHIEKIIRDLHDKLSKNINELDFITQLEILQVITKALTLKNIINNLPNYIIKEYSYQKEDTTYHYGNNTLDKLFNKALEINISAKHLNYYFKYVDTIYINFEYNTVRPLKETTLFKLISIFLNIPTHLNFEIKDSNSAFYNNIPLKRNNEILHITIYSILYQLKYKKSIITDKLLKRLLVKNSEILQEEIQNYKLQLASMKYAVTQFEKELNELPIN